MEQSQIFDPINIPVPKNEILSRLGFRQGITKINEKQKKETEGYIDEALCLIKLKGVAKRFLIQDMDSRKIIIAGGAVFESGLLAEFLKDSSEVLLMAATAGNRIMEAIAKESSGNNFTRGVVFDAAASEMADAGLDWIMSYFNRQLLRENKTLGKKRFSCGYGDFLLKNQKTIYGLLKLNDLGIKITENFILIPEKSVTAVSGIKGVS
ncbi:MAG: methionine synthase [Candidatus Omnitrophica bacterium]|nr:methionine synthase [Candidatus Omnitrophota bacterium]